MGLELYAISGLELVDDFKRMGFPIFLDLKLHDIPTTVERTLKVLTTARVDMVNLHCGGGYEMMARASEVCHQAGMKVIGVTVLTSMGEEGLREVGVEGAVSIGTQISPPGKKKAGLDGAVASRGEAALLRADLEQFSW